MDEIWAGTTLYTFDGRVLEVFGFPGAESMRFHVLNLRIEVDEPNSKGRRWLRIRPLHGGGGLATEVEPQEWPLLGPFLDRVGAATRPPG